MLRNLMADAREFPATMLVGLAWIVVFAAMVVTRINDGAHITLFQFTVGNFVDAHRFGDLTLPELFGGQAWRAVTCTFVHYNLLHIGMNLFGLYQLGCLVESWYGSGQFLAIYVLIGGGGNYVSAYIRRAIGSDFRVHSGGGSTVVLGLVALCAVVGWRSKTQIGNSLRRQMVWILLLTAGLGQVFSIIDNWGHAGGAIVGAVLGFLHRTMVHTIRRPVAHLAGVFGVVILVASAVAQMRQDRVEAPSRARARVVASKRSISILLGVQALHQAGKRPRSGGSGEMLQLLDACRDDLDRPPTAPDYQALRRIIERERSNAARSSKDGEFRNTFQSLLRLVSKRHDESVKEFLAIQAKERRRRDSPALESTGAAEPRL